VEAPIFIGFPGDLSSPCLAGVLRVCLLVLFTIWVTPESELTKVGLRGSSVLTQEFRGPQMGCELTGSDRTQFTCIKQVTDFGDLIVLCRLCNV
jgi:hypothetical protein